MATRSLVFKQICFVNEIEMVFKRKYPFRARVSKYKKRTPYFRKRSKLNAKTMVRIARREVLKKCETKYRQASGENITLYHDFSDGALGTTGNAVNKIQNLCQTVQGNSQNQRVGDEIYPVGISLRLWLSNKDVRPNVMYRIIVYTCPPDQVYANTPSAFWAGASGNKMIDFINVDKYKVIKHMMIKPFAGDYSLETGATNKEHSSYRKLWIPVKGPIKYQTDNGDVPKYQKHNICVAIGAYDAYGTVVTNDLATFAYTYRFYFKDP